MFCRDGAWGERGFPHQAGSRFLVFLCLPQMRAGHAHRGMAQMGVQLLPQFGTVFVSCNDKENETKHFHFKKDEIKRKLICVVNKEKGLGAWSGRSHRLESGGAQRVTGTWKFPQSPHSGIPGWAPPRTSAQPLWAQCLLDILMVFQDHKPTQRWLYKPSHRLIPFPSSCIYRPSLDSFILEINIFFFLF